MTGDYYAILGVPPTAPPEDIRRAYREMVRQHDRDRIPDEAAEKKLQRIQAAFEVLSDPQRRAAYDRDVRVSNSSRTGDVETAAGGSDCPSCEQLVAYNLGKLPEEALQGIAAHLETCSGCLTTLSTLPETEDSLVSQLGGPPGEEEFLDEPECSRAVLQFEAIGSEPSPSGRFDNVADLSVPKKLGRYRLLEELGRGGMGTVYLAEDTQLDRRVALKIPHFRTVVQRDSGKNPAFLERFYREARAAAKIRHANLCPVYDVGEIEGFPYLSMAYIPGRSLAKLIRDKVSFPEREAAEIVRKLALAVQEAHGHGVVHRDIKPSNVILAENGEPILTDFGLAQIVEADRAKLTHCGVIVGTPAYMAPEQVDGDLEGVGPGCDIYSLGVVLYELLTGEVPFRGPLLSVISQIEKDRPDPPSLRRANLERRLEAICLKAMAKDAADRYPSAGEMAAALGRYLQAKPEPAAARPRRRRSIYIAAAVVAVLLAVGTLVYLRGGEGVLVLEVNQPDVSVAIDGKPIQIETPDEEIPVKAGRHRLKVSKEGFYSHRQPFAVRRGEKVVLVATLRKQVAVGGAAAGSLRQILLNPTRDPGDRFGFSLAAVGNNILVGAHQDDTDGRNAGIAYLFSSSTGRRLLTFHNPSPAADDHFGEVVAAMDRNVLIAAPQPFSGGAGFVCVFDGSSGKLLICLRPPTPRPGDAFGSSVAALGNKVFIGAPRDDTVATDAGAVYAFEFDGRAWKLRPDLLKHTPRPNDKFGCSLAAVGDRLLVGAVGDNQHGADAGAVYLFDASTGRKLRAFWNPSPVAGDVFGRSIAGVGDRVLVGSFMDDTGAENAGVAYLFDAATGNLVQTFLNPTPAIDEYFGWSVAAVGDYVLIGAHLDDTGGGGYVRTPYPSTAAENAGAAYLFDASSGKLVQAFHNPSPAAHDHFGYCVAALGNNALIGTRRAGTVYLFAGPDSGKDPTPDSPADSGDKP